MKRITTSLMITLALTLGIIANVNAQGKKKADKKDKAETTEVAAAPVNDMADDAAVSTGDAAVSEAANTGTTDNAKKKEEAKKPDLTFTQQLKQKYIEGDVVWMTPVLICMIIGMALSIERVIYLNLSTINTSKFIQDVEKALQNGGVDAAKELCRNTRGPIASIFYQGLDRAGEGLDMVEKSVVAYGGVQMGNMEKGLSWLQLFIALSPMLGFLGTVIGMIQAFDKIVEDGQVSPTTVADGIKVALLTTVFGLIAAIALQIFYNYITSKIDGLVNEMEDASISLIDILLKNKAVK
ncbi:MAG: MotA/TolQ/ExbB proton channel family protein [Crocinitomicaceae bacterium]